MAQAGGARELTQSYVPACPCSLTIECGKIACQYFISALVAADNNKLGAPGSSGAFKSRSQPLGLRTRGGVLFN